MSAAGSLHLPRRVLVAGGAGFIGSNFVRSVLEDSDLERLVNLDRLTYAGNLENLHGISEGEVYRFVRGDIADAERVGALLREEAIDTVVNFAAHTHVDRSIDDPEPFFRTNVMGTLRLLGTLHDYWRSGSRPTAFRLLHLSTDEVYGSLAAEDPPSTEGSPLAPNSPYAASKAGADHAVRSYFRTYGLPAVTVRCVNAYGPYQFPEKLIPLTILNALELKPLPLYGDGMQSREWIHVSDACVGIAGIAKAGRDGETYNLGSGTRLPNLEVVRSICTHLDRLSPRADGRSYTELITPVIDRPGHDRRYALDSAKVQREIGWAPRTVFAEGIERTIVWYLENRPWSERITAETYHRQRLGLAE